MVVAIVLVYKILELLYKMFAGLSCSQFGHIHKNLNGLLNFEADHANVNRLFLFSLHIGFLLLGLVLLFRLPLLLILLFVPLLGLFLGIIVAFLLFDFLITLF